MENKVAKNITKTVKKTASKGRAFLMSLSGIALAASTSAVVVPSLLKFESKAKTNTPTIDPEMIEKVSMTVTTDKSGNTKCLMTTKDSSQQVASVTVKKGVNTLLTDEYSFNKTEQSVTIPSKVMSKYSGSVVVTPTLESKEIVVDPIITKDDNVVSAKCSKVVLNKDFNITCTFINKYTLDTTNTKITVGTTELVETDDYVINDNVINVKAKAVINSNINIHIASKRVPYTKNEFIEKSNEWIIGTGGFCDSTTIYNKSGFTWKIDGEEQTSNISYIGSGSNRVCNIYDDNEINFVQVGGSIFSGDQFSNYLEPETTPGVTYEITDEFISYKNTNEIVSPALYSTKELRINKYGYVEYWVTYDIINETYHTYEIIYNQAPHEPVLSGISLGEDEGQEIALEVESTKDLTATLNYNLDEDITWSSSDETVAAFNGEKTATSKSGEPITITALAEGSSTITATCGEFTASCSVTVEPAVERVNVTLIFNNSEQTVQTVRVKKGSTMAEPVLEDREDGAMYAGWYSEEPLTRKDMWDESKRFDFNNTINEDKVFYCRWGNEFNNVGWPVIKPAIATFESLASPTADDAKVLLLSMGWDEEEIVTGDEDTAQTILQNNAVGVVGSIKLNDRFHSLKCIDAMHDNMADGTATIPTGKAAFTFELFSLLSDSAGNRLTCAWDADHGQNNEHYTEGTMFNALNSTDEVDSWQKLSYSSGSYEKISAYSMLVKAGLTPKNVTKSAGVGSSYISTQYNCYCFPITFREMAQTGYYAPYNEGTAYKYWTDNEKLEDKNARRVKKDLNNNQVHYWLASPKTDTNGRAWIVYCWGGTFSNYSVNEVEKVGASFAFCI